MTGPGNIIAVFSLAVIPAKAGIQTRQSTISNNVCYIDHCWYYGLSACNSECRTPLEAQFSFGNSSNMIVTASDGTFATLTIVSVRVDYPLTFPTYLGRDIV
jgi:hypothetical protein